MSSYFAIYRGWRQYGAERSAERDASETLNWDFVPLAGALDDATMPNPADLGRPGRSGPITCVWPVLLLRRLVRLAVYE
jgi:hypothetical protein